MFIKKLIITCITAISIVIFTNASAQVNKEQNIMMTSPWGPDGGTHGFLEVVIAQLENRGWNINNGRGAISLGNCAKQKELVRTSDDPVVYLLHSALVRESVSKLNDPCYLDLKIESNFVGFSFSWTSFISRVDENLPPIHEATGPIRVGVDPADQFTDEHMKALKELAPNAMPILIRYHNTPQTVQGVKAGEVDYTWQPINEKRTDGLVITDYHVGDGKIEGVPRLIDVVPEINFTFSDWAGHFHSGLDEQTLEEFKNDYHDIITNNKKINNMFANRLLAPPQLSPNEMSLSTISGKIGLDNKNE